MYTIKVLVELLMRLPFKSFGFYTTFQISAILVFYFKDHSLKQPRQIKSLLSQVLLSHPFLFYSRTIA